ncbi:MAG: DNA translocase FtsK 4TM domain-containing protein [Candidatus Omnitrophica bacterium]|nr:DNA translocase FtsK 4TM domain-containing protein [Candidatus Omnitrophota bacterium]
MKKIGKGITCLSLFSLSVILTLALLSFQKEDFSLYTSHPNYPPKNLIGIFGLYLGGGLIFLLGKYSPYLIVLALILAGLRTANILKTPRPLESTFTLIIALIITLLSFSLLFSLPYFQKEGSLSFEKGGLIGYIISMFLSKYLGITGAFIIGGIFFLSGVLILEGEAILKLFKNISNYLKKIYSNYKEKKVTLKKIDRELKKPRIKFKLTPSTPDLISVKKKKAPPKKNIILTKPSSQENLPTLTKTRDGFQLPPPSLLKKPPPVDVRKLKEDIELNSRNLKETLTDFGIEARIVNVEKGPVVTLYELELAPGTKITKISSLADDIALALKSSQVRIVAPLPGKGTVGVEVPNSFAHIVYLREVIESKEFTTSKSKLTLGIGKNTQGLPLVADLKEMPHLLIAGTTGSGKTVCVNSLICSILFKATPEEAKFILIDPKMVELAQFSEIPHLLCPIISEPKKAKSVLLWATEEMEKRYNLLAEEGTRNIDLYNLRKNKEERLPFIVIVIDELADLMVVARDEIETAILRLSQLSRAVGIHLILATQRPSVDVITGVIKANFPARISFKVASKIDSRTVLDIVGAEKLLGRGDLLFIKPGMVKLIRAQGCFLNEEDLETLVNFIKNQAKPTYNQEILELQKKPKITLEKDELLDEAIKVVLEANQASASILQRRLRVGYTRAARLLDLMEQEGIVGPFQGSKPRLILVDREDYLKKYQQGKE